MPDPVLIQRGPEHTVLAPTWTDCIPKPMLSTKTMDAEISSKPIDEAARLSALNTFGVLDTPPEQAYDDLTALAALV